MSPSSISVVLHDLFDAVLCTTAIDEAAPGDDEWLRSTVRNDDDFLAVTRDAVYIGLLTRRELVNHVLSMLTEHSMHAAVN